MVSVITIIKRTIHICAQHQCPPLLNQNYSGGRDDQGKRDETQLPHFSPICDTQTSQSRRLLSPEKLQQGREGVGVPSQGDFKDSNQIWVQNEGQESEMHSPGLRQGSWLATELAVEQRRSNGHMTRSPSAPRHPVGRKLYIQATPGRDKAGPICLCFSGETVWP